MYKIYMLEFPNNKKYIGCTKSRFNYRTGANGSKYTATKIKEAITKYGWNNVKKTIIKDKLTYQEAKYYENFYITKYNTLDDLYGYNSKEGGDFKEKIKTYKHIMTPAKQKWIDSLKNKPLSEEHKKNMREGQSKVLDYYIIQYDLNNNFIKKWNSMNEVERELGIKRQLIANCCLLNEVRPEINHVSKNYIWRKEKKEIN